MDSINVKMFVESLLTLFDEGYVGPADSKGTWFVDNEPDCGFLGTVEKLSAKDASRGFGEFSVAAHANHLRYSLELANRAFRGENPYASADWKGSWNIREVDEGEWKKLKASLRREYEDFRSAIAAGIKWDDPLFLTGTLGQLAHGAWHLGAVRQLLSALKGLSPRDGS